MSTIDLVQIPAITTSGVSKEQAERMAQEIMYSVLWTGTRSMERQAYDVFYAYQDENAFQYLTGKGKWKMPAKVRMIPVAKPYFDILESTAESRPVVTRCYAVDEGSVHERMDARARHIVDMVLDRRTVRMQRMELMKQAVEQRKQAIQQSAQQAGAQGGPQVDPIAMGQVDLQLSRIEDELERGIGVSRTEVEEAERQFNETFQTQREKKINAAMRYLSQQQGWKDLFMRGFRDQMIVDNQIWRINDIYLGQDPSFRRCSPYNIWYNADPDSTWLDEANWVVERRYMRPEQLIQEYGEQMSQEQLKMLQNVIPQLNSQDLWIPNVMSMGNQLNINNCDYLYNGNTYNSLSMVEVYEVEFKTLRKVLFRSTEDKNRPGTFHTHLITEGDVKKEDQVEVRYVTDYWRATNIMGQFFVNVRKSPFQFREHERIGRAYSSYIGLAYSGPDNRPYSRTLAVKDVIILYCLTYYQIEKLQALSGLKGVVMDISQRPDTMSNEEWFYNLSRGILAINSAQIDEETGRRSNFNAFASFDLTAGNTIQQLQAILEGLKSLLGGIMGIPPQRLGEIAPREQVGSAKAAIVQSNLTTDVLFKKDARVKERLMNRILTVLPYAWKEGKRGAYMLGREQQLFDIAAGELDDMRFRLFYGDGGVEEERIQQVKGLLMNEYQNKQTINLSQMIGLLNMDTLGEIESAARHFEELAQKKLVQNQQIAEQAKMDAQARLMEVEQRLKSQPTALDMMKQKVQEANLQLEQHRIDQQAQVAMAKTQQDNETRKYDTDSERMTEMAYLQEQIRETNIDAQLRRMELMLEGLSNGAERLSSPRAKENISDR